MADDFEAGITGFNVSFVTRLRELFVNVVSATGESIVNGSPVTTAPGQPVDTGHLRGSWQTDFEGPDAAVIATNCEYAPVIEENPKGVHFHNHGPHSVDLTRAGFGAIVETEAAKLGVRSHGAGGTGGDTSGWSL